MTVLSYPQIPTYRVIQTEVADEDGILYPTYGIEAIDQNGNILRQIPDISLSEPAVTTLAHKMNTHIRKRFFELIYNYLFYAACISYKSTLFEVILI